MQASPGQANHHDHQYDYSGLKLNSPERIIALTIKNNTKAITVDAAIFRHKYGFCGADVACPVVAFSGGFTPKGSVMKNTHHHNRIYTTTDDTISILCPKYYEL